MAPKNIRSKSGEGNRAIPEQSTAQTLTGEGSTPRSEAHKGNSSNPSFVPRDDKVDSEKNSTDDEIEDIHEILNTVEDRNDTLVIFKGVLEEDDLDTPLQQVPEPESEAKDYVQIDSDEDTESTELSRKRKGKELKRRTQPARGGKRTKTSAKRGAEVSVPKEPTARTKTVLDEIGIDETFLKENHLEEVYDWISFQGWGELFREDEKVDKGLVAEFYKKVTKEEKGQIVYLNFEFKGQELTVSSRDLAYELGLKHEGFDTFTKRQWPESITDAMKEELETRICNYSDLTHTDLSTLQMDPKVKILHRFLVSTILPRGSKPAFAQIQDILLLDQIIRKQKVNLPKLIIHQMEYNSQYQFVGHARIVKKILQFQNVYNPQTEESVLRPLTVNSIHRWGIQFVKDQGWVRKRNVSEEVPVQKVEEKTEKTESSSETFKERFDKLEREVSDVKLMISELKTEVGKIVAGQWMIDEELNGLKNLIKTGFAKLSEK